VFYILFYCVLEYSQYSVQCSGSDCMDPGLESSSSRPFPRLGLAAISVTTSQCSPSPTSVPERTPPVFHPPRSNHGHVQLSGYSAARVRYWRSTQKAPMTHGVSYCRSQKRCWTVLLLTSPCPSQPVSLSTTTNIAGHHRCPVDRRLRAVPYQ